jgi:hypothetical protein
MRKPPLRARAYAVGYGSPPREHQFRPGRSGNPRGRPKGAKSEATILRGLLNRKVDIRDGGTTRKITVLEAILLRFTQEALKGDTKSAAFMLNRHAGMRAEESQPNDDVNDDDRNVLEDFVRRFVVNRRRNRRDRS